MSTGPAISFKINGKPVGTISYYLRCPLSRFTGSRRRQMRVRAALRAEAGKIEALIRCEASRHESARRLKHGFQVRSG